MVTITFSMRSPDKRFIGRIIRILSRTPEDKIIEVENYYYNRYLEHIGARIKPVAK